MCVRLCKYPPLIYQYYRLHRHSIAKKVLSFVRVIRTMTSMSTKCCTLWLFCYKFVRIFNTVYGGGTINGMSAKRTWVGRGVNSPNEILDGHAVPKFKKF